MGAAQVAQQPLHFFHGQYHRQALRLLRPHHPINFGQRSSEHHLVEEHDGIERLILRRRRHPTVHRQLGEKRADLCFAHLGRVPLAMEQDEPLDPAQIGILGAEAVVPHPDRAAHLLQKGRRFVDGPCDESSLAGLILYETTVSEPGLPAAGAFAFALEKDGFLRPCGLYGNVPELRGGRLVWWPMEERRWSVYVIVQEGFLVEGLPDPAYTHPARVVRDMRKC